MLTNHLKKYMFILFIVVITMACSNTPEASTPARDNKAEIKPYATEVEEMLKEGPGVFAGENYDKEKLEAELMKLPSNLTGEKAYQYLIHYLAEDYKPYVKKLDQFNTTYEIGSGPEGSVNSRLKQNRNRPMWLFYWIRAEAWPEEWMVIQK